LRYASLRYFNVAGAPESPDGILRGEAHDPETHLIPLILDVALGRRDSIRIYGEDYPTPDGTCIRDYIHVSDLADAHLLALEALASRDRLICNLGNGHGFSVREVIESARRVTGHPIPAVVHPRRPGDPAVLVAGSGIGNAMRREAASAFASQSARFPLIPNNLSSGKVEFHLLREAETRWSATAIREKSRCSVRFCNHRTSLHVQSTG
jgi:nucleoside-diphosphate-sugar epimerase